MNPCELNAAIAAITNYLYTTMDDDDFLFASVVLSELSKSMFAMAVLRDICEREKRKGKKREKKDKKEEK